MAGEKLKLSQIRAQYPVYADVSDEDLVRGLWRKHYSDIPLAQFTNAIEFDTGPKATDGMSGTEKFLAGAGKAFADIGRGAGQLIGVVSREDVAEANKRDADLMKSGAGMAGNIAGNVAALLPTMLIPGGAALNVLGRSISLAPNTLTGAGIVGAGSGLLAPSESTDETLQNVAIGGMAGPAGLIAGRAIGAVYQGGKALLAPFTEGGRDKIVARTMQRFAGGPDEARKVAGQLANPPQLVPGSTPTVAQITDNAGIAQLERSVRSLPDMTQPFAARDAANREARRNALRTIAGTDAERAAAEAARDTKANALYQVAYDAGIDPARVTPEVTARIDTLMKRPSMQRATQRANELALEEGIPLESLEGSVRGLHLAKKALEDEIAAAGPSGIGPTKKRALEQTRNELLDLIDTLSPEYAAARRQFAADSRPINQMDVGARLYESLVPAAGDLGVTTRETLGRYAEALRNIDATAAKATGFKGAKAGDVLTPDQMNLLRAIGEDLGRVARAAEAGRSVGSNTAQNLAGQNLIAEIAGPLGIRGEGAADMLLRSILGRPMDFAAKAATPALQQRLAEAMMDPVLARRLLELVERQRLSARIGSAVDPLLAPVTTGAAIGGANAQ